MNNLIINFCELFKNIKIDVKLEGWPAAVTGVSICGTIVGVYALKVTHPSKSSSDSEYAQTS